MIWLQPQAVVFDGSVLDEVDSVVVDREAGRLVESYSDGGAYAVFADVPQQRVRVRVVRKLVEARSPGVSPGDLGSLEFEPSRNASAGQSVRVEVASAMVMSVTHTVTRSAGARQTVEFVALSSDGGADPVVWTELS